MYYVVSTYMLLRCKFARLPADSDGGGGGGADISTVEKLGMDWFLPPLWGASTPYCDLLRTGSAVDGMLVDARDVKSCPVVVATTHS